MSFVAALKNISQYQLVSMAKDGITYLLLMNARDAQRAVARFAESGYISLKEGTILWQGVGKIPKEIRQPLVEVGLMYPESTS